VSHGTDHSRRCPVVARAGVQLGSSRRGAGVRLKGIISGSVNARRASSAGRLPPRVEAPRCEPLRMGR
jgi:hypothetical protein